MNLSILSPLEAACLRWIANGKSIRDIARLEGLEPIVVENCLRRAIDGLQAKSIKDAVDKVCGGCPC